MIARLTAAVAAAWLLLGLPGAEAANFRGFWGHGDWGDPKPPPRSSAARANGQACRHQGDCQEKNCRRFPDGGQYCVAAGRVCPAPGSDAAPPGKKVSSRGQCFECKLGQGWVACD